MKQYLTWLPIPPEKSSCGMRREARMRPEPRWTGWSVQSYSHSRYYEPCIVRRGKTVQNSQTAVVTEAGLFTVEEPPKNLHQLVRLLDIVSIERVSPTLCTCSPAGDMGSESGWNPERELDSLPQSVVEAGQSFSQVFWRHHYTSSKRCFQSRNAKIIADTNRLPIETHSFDLLLKGVDDRRKNGWCFPYF